MGMVRSTKDNVASSTEVASDIRLVEEALGNVKKPAPWDGECSEIENLTRILDEHLQIKPLEQAKEVFKGATSESAFVGHAGDPAHGTKQ
ncbi:hypothetical protein [Tuwongella immobilis]|uniref:hypothetical protein n=1 Tax=Tuwongella immobilis TaxID=692036 RepID=UPI001E286E7F|nr:hypothetical protein [Tuwongella immobilis]